MGDQLKTLRVLRHGSEMTIPAHQFNPATDTKLDPETGDTDAAESTQTGTGGATAARPSGATGAAGKSSDAGKTTKE